jgi:hypothetical protein
VVAAAEAVPKEGAEAGVLEAVGKLKPPVPAACVLEEAVDPPKLKAGAEAVGAAEAPKPWGAVGAAFPGVWPKLKVVPVP